MGRSSPGGGPFPCSAGQDEPEKADGSMILKF